MAALVGAADLLKLRDPERVKALKAGAQFEALLLNNVLGAVEHAFTNLPEGKESPATDPYRGFAMQALSLGLAERGGIGLGRLMARALSKRQGTPESPKKNS
jgi:Rod binding domain-containing protein